MEDGARKTLIDAGVKEDDSPCTARQSRDTYGMDIIS